MNLMVSRLLTALQTGVSDAEADGDAVTDELEVIVCDCVAVVVAVDDGVRVADPVVLRVPVGVGVFHIIATAVVAMSV